ncbi:MAG: tetratricopeptide repeat protein, partial [Saprospiraceae bacterium]|nr:tetratricopeptide repeat protein [Saprospiraceae bacterium]
STCKEEEELALKLVDANGNELISYKPITKKADLPLPNPVIPPKSPEDIETTEELYITGLRLKQFHNARISPEIYFLEALRRDPLDIRSNTMMGIISKEDFRLDDAARYFRSALQRLSVNYTRPRNCEPLYHLGVILQRQGKYDAAYDTLYRAAWDQDFASAAYFHLAQISMIRKNHQMALSEINRSLDYNNTNLRALTLKISVLRKLGKKEEARDNLSTALQKDALNFYAINEGTLLGEMDSRALKQLGNRPESYLELSIEYLNTGLLDEAKAILDRAANSEHEKLSDHPTIHYYLGYLYDNMNNAEKAAHHFDLGNTLSTDYCFPFRFESIEIFESAIAYNPSDSRAYYYLGNLLYDKQPAQAIISWEKAVELEPDLAIAHRNIGWGYYQIKNDLVRAIAAYEAAVHHDKTQAKYYYELDKLYERSGTDIQKRYEFLIENHAFVSQRPDAFLQEVQVMLLFGKYEKAIDYLLNNFFPRQEGVDNLHDIYVDACLAQGINELRSDNPKNALEYFLMASDYPTNHQIARSLNYDRDVQIQYFQALSYEKLNKTMEASSLLEKISKLEIREPRYKFYKALAYQKLENKKQVESLVEELEKKGKELLSSTGGVDYFSKFGEGASEDLRKSEGNYLLGLINLINGNQESAMQHLEQAHRLNPNDLWIKINMQNN